MFLALDSVADNLPTAQIVLALTMAFGVLTIVLELVRRQKLREEYAVLWICTSIVLIVLALSPGILTWFSELFETQSLVSLLYFGGFVFLLMVALQFSVRLTKLTFRSKTTGQRIALLEAELESLKKQLEARKPEIEIPETKSTSDKKVS